ncbi:MAG: c-type cytochrome [Chloroflexi bacterium]|nr:c-type cytochrome [Chloroflexota bacterium]
MAAWWTRVRSGVGVLVRGPVWGLTWGLALGLTGCVGAPSPLDPRTEAAARIAELGWMMIALATVVCIAVFGGLLAALRTMPRQPVELQRRSAATARSEQAERAVLLGGLILPAAILVFTFGYTVYTLRQVAGVAGSGGASGFAAHDDHAPSLAVPQPRPPGTPPPSGALGAPAALLASVGGRPGIEVQLIGHQWWWEIVYPVTGVVTANELHIPSGVPISLTVTSADVIHSFWVPQVTGKVDLIPGKANTLTLRAEQPGVYRGMCSEFCGLQHAMMHLRLVVQTPETFAAWLQAQQQAAAIPASPAAAQGQQVFAARCAECHTVRGLTDGTRGPDLTHVASRSTLGAGIHENTRANLTGWTRDAQTMKPGNKMASIPLSDDDLTALLAYLEGLR